MICKDCGLKILPVEAHIDLPGLVRHTSHLTCIARLRVAMPRCTTNPNHRDRMAVTSKCRFRGAACSCCEECRDLCDVQAMPLKELAELVNSGDPRSQIMRAEISNRGYHVQSILNKPMEEFE